MAGVSSDPIGVLTLQLVLPHRLQFREECLAMGVLVRLHAIWEDEAVFSRCQRRHSFGVHQSWHTSIITLGIEHFPVDLGARLDAHGRVSQFCG